MNGLVFFNILGKSSRLANKAKVYNTTQID